MIVLLAALAVADPPETSPWDVAGAEVPTPPPAPVPHALGPKLDELPESPFGPPPRPTASGGLPLPAWPVRPARRRVALAVAGLVLLGGGATAVVAVGPALDP